MRRLLLPLSWIYGAAVAVRNFCYDRGIFSVTRIGTPVISVGNITAGGTGKTPLVEYIVGKLLGAGLRPAILSRGYRRTTRGTLTVSDGVTVKAGADAAGDEPAQIAAGHPGCVVVVDEDRVRGARFIESAFGPDAIVLDDGFQHRAIGRDLDIVVLGAGPGDVREPLLPAGNGREPLRSLRRANLIVVNRSGGGSGAGAPGDAGQYAGSRDTGGLQFPRAADAPIIMEYRLSRFLDAATRAEIRRDDLASGRCVAFCGIGNPASFRATLSSQGLEPEAFLAFGDHHRYSAADLAKIGTALERSGANYAVTTEKDAVRLGGKSMPPLPFRGRMVVAVIAVSMAGGGDALDSALLAAAGRRRA